MVNAMIICWVYEWMSETCGDRWVCPRPPVLLEHRDISGAWARDLISSLQNSLLWGSLGTEECTPITFCSPLLHRWASVLSIPSVWEHPLLGPRCSQSTGPRSVGPSPGQEPRLWNGKIVKLWPSIRKPTNPSLPCWELCLQTMIWNNQVQISFLSLSQLAPCVSVCWEIYYWWCRCLSRRLQVLLELVHNHRNWECVPGAQ